MLKSILSVLIAFATFFSSFASIFTGKDEAGKLPDELKDIIAANYAELIAEVDGNENRIPVIVTTDQHGAITVDSDLYDYFNSIVDWTKVSKIINLGDTVRDEYNLRELVAYNAATKNLPEDKRIEVCGNHDRRNLGTNRGLRVSRFFFPTEGAVYSADKRVFTVTDEDFGIRYLVVDPKVSPWSYTSGILTSDMADFIIAEFEKDDNTDIVLLSHPYLFRDALVDRNGEPFKASEWFIGGETEYADVRESFFSMLEAKKNGTSGVLTDCDGNTHAYDFSNSNSEFLLALHGHHHTEGYETNYGVTEFLFQSMTLDNAENSEPFCTYFAYIDKETKTIKVWKNLEGYSAWEISFE